MDVFYSCYQAAIFSAQQQSVSQYTSSKVREKRKTLYLDILFPLVAGFGTYSFSWERKTHLLMLYLKLSVDSLQLSELTHSAGLNFVCHIASLSHNHPESHVQYISLARSTFRCDLLTLGQARTIISLYKYKVTAISTRCGIIQPFKMFSFYCSNNTRSINSCLSVIFQCY